MFFIHPTVAAIVPPNNRADQRLSDARIAVRDRAHNCGDAAIELTRLFGLTPKDQEFGDQLVADLTMEGY